jgi:hypothetical protein
MNLTIIVILSTFFLISCDKKSENPQSVVSLDDPVLAEQDDLDTAWIDELPAQHRDAIRQAIANDGVLVSKLDGLLDAVNSGMRKEDIEKQFGPPDTFHEDVATYVDTRFNIPIYAGLKGLSEVRFRYEDGVASYSGSVWVN